jgi:hypothetical protein
VPIIFDFTLGSNLKFAVKLVTTYDISWAEEIFKILKNINEINNFFMS